MQKFWLNVLGARPEHLNFYSTPSDSEASVLQTTPRKILTYLNSADEQLQTEEATSPRQRKAKKQKMDFKKPFEDRKAEHKSLKTTRLLYFIP